MDLEFSPSILHTPSLMTPNIGFTPLIYRPSHTTTVNTNNNEDNNSISNPSSIVTTTMNDESSLSASSSAEIKLSKIEDELKQSFSQPRKPTESPFQKMVEARVVSTGKIVSLPPTTEESMPIEIPSTAEVVNDIESFSKFQTKDNLEREIAAVSTILSDNNRFETLPVHNMGVIVSPKKALLMRSQSHTEPTSPLSNNHFSQSQKNNLDDESQIDDDHQSAINQHFQHVHDLPIITHPIDTKPQIDNSLEPSYIHLRINQNGVHPTMIKQQPIVINKRSFQQTLIVPPIIPKGTSIHIPQQPIINEVTSSDQLSGIKRQKMTPIPTNPIILRSAFPASPTDDEDNNNNGSDDHRKRQIRDSNREAARRCRERRRQYIEQLEGNLEQHKMQIRQMSENLSRAERENTQLRAILTETKIFHSAPRHSSNDSILDFANVITSTNEVDLNSESTHQTDGNTNQRNYVTRNIHLNMKLIFFFCFIPTILSSSYHKINIKSDDDCWTNVNNQTINKKYAIQVEFSPLIAYGKDGCSIHITNPWLSRIENGFGLFLSRNMDCSSTVTVDCLPDSTLTNRTKPLSVQLTCHTSDNKVEMPCSSISLTFKRKINSEESKKPTYVQVVALAKEPCADDDIFFQCPRDYPHSCIDKKLQCNGRSECPSGDDERDCHPSPPRGVSIFVIIAIVLACLFVFCILSTVLICCCCRAAFIRISRRFRSEKKNKSIEKGDITINGEDAGLIRGLNTQPFVVEVLPQQNTEPAPLIIDSTKPMYPRLE